VEESAASKSRITALHQKEKSELSRKLTELSLERDNAIRSVQSLENRLESISKSSSNNDTRINMVINENSDLKKKIWEAETLKRDADEKRVRCEKENKEVFRKNEELNRIIEGMEADILGKQRSNAGGLGSPSLLRYDIKPLY
jgi:hypothetical protein